MPSNSLNLLQVVRDVCLRQGIPAPATVVGSTDTQVLQMMALLEEEGNDLSSRHPWSQLTLEQDFFTVPTQLQGLLVGYDDTSIISGPAFRYIKNDTIWDRSSRLPVCGPMDGQEWQAMQAMNATGGPRYRFRIFNDGGLYITPAPPNGETWYFEYVTSEWIRSLNGVEYRNRFEADTDVIRLPNDLVVQGLRWRWKKEKGFDYAEDFRTYELQVKDAMAHDGGKRVLHMDSSGRGVRPGIWVSPMSWDL